jgi:hypothetical protein
VLIFEKDNPSGLPESAGEFSVPVSFESCTEEEVVEAYIEENIATLSLSAPVLGGTWQVTSVEFRYDHSVKVTYEDGHIEESFTAKYAVSSDGDVEILEIN